MATSNRPYQGYPYVNPLVVDVPSISADDAGRWHNLPRRQMELNHTREASTGLPDKSAKIHEAKGDRNLAPVVYIDLPETSGSIVADRQFPEDRDLLLESSSRTNKEDLDAPVVYIDFPESSGSNVARSLEHTPHEEPTFVQTLESSSRTNKEDLDAPVVYIDFPESSGSNVARSLEHTPQEEPTFVQDTIFYNPFENRRIDVAKEVESDDESEVSSHNVIRLPARQHNLDPNGAGPSAGPSSIYSNTTGMSSLMSKEAAIYGRTDDGFPASPIPISQFPEPPPAYTEMELPSPVVEQPRAASPSQTTVIVPREYVTQTPIGMPNSERKYLDCQHCGMRVHSLVVKANGIVAHASAISCLIICCYPAIALIYCTDIFKKKNHYCPNCNRIIGFEQPFTSDKIIYKPKTI